MLVLSSNPPPSCLYVGYTPCTTVVIYPPLTPSIVMTYLLTYHASRGIECLPLLYQYPCTPILSHAHFPLSYPPPPSSHPLIPPLSPPLIGIPRLTHARRSISRSLRSYLVEKCHQPQFPHQTPSIQTLRHEFLRVQHLHSTIFDSSTTTLQFGFLLLIRGEWAR